MTKIVNEFQLLRPLPVRGWRYIVKLIRSNNKEASDGNLIINYSHYLNKPVTKLRTYLKYDYSAVTTGKLKGEPTAHHYFNHLGSMDDIYTCLEVFASEIKPFNLTFRIFGVLEVYDMLGGYTYTAEQVHWNTNKDIKPIIIKTSDDFKLVKEYINTTLMKYKTSSSSKPPSIVEAFEFMVPQILKIRGIVKGLPDVFIKSKPIIIENEDDHLCWHRFLALCLYPEFRNTKKYNIKDRT